MKFNTKKELRAVRDAFRVHKTVLELEVERLGPDSMFYRGAVAECDNAIHNFKVLDAASDKRYEPDEVIEVQFKGV